MIKNGIVAVGDISNTDYSIQKKSKNIIYYHTFVESYASNKIFANKAFNHSLKLYEMFQAINNNKNSVSITPHAPYSVSDLLFNKLSEWIINNNGIVSIHNQESESENEMFISGTGKLAQFIKSFGSEINDFVIGKHSIYNVFDKLPKKNNIQFVHNTYSTAEDIAAAKINFEKSFWCVCPNANLYIENKLPDVAALVRENCKITIGTDSLASNHQLSILEELKTIQTQFNFLPLNELLKWATLNGAEFLGIDKFYGSFEKGKKPGILLLKNLDYVGMNIGNDSTIKVIN